MKHLNSTIDKNSNKYIACYVSSESYDDDYENELTNSISLSNDRNNTQERNNR